MDDRPETGVSIEEVIGPDGRYVLYYRWADGTADSETDPHGGPPPGDPPPTTGAPLRPLDADV